MVRYLLLRRQVLRLGDGIDQRYGLNRLASHVLDPAAEFGRTTNTRNDNGNPIGRRCPHLKYYSFLPGEYLTTSLMTSISLSPARFQVNLLACSRPAWE